MAEKPVPYFRPHPLAPIFSSDRPDKLLTLKHLIQELTSEHGQSNARVVELLRQCALTCFWFFLKFVCGAAGPYDKLNDNLHVDMCNFRSSDHCMSPGSKVFCFLPRNHRKSTIFTHGANTWELTRDPTQRIRLVNAVIGRAQLFMHCSQRTADSNPVYALLFPECVPHKSRYKRKRWTDKEAQWPSCIGNPVEPSIKPGGAEGASEGDHHTILTIDDLLGLDDLTVELLNSTDMYKKMQWFKTNHRTLLDDWNTSRIIGAATRYAPDDVYQWIVERARACYGYPMPGFKAVEEGEWIIYHRSVVEDGEFTQPETMNEKQFRQLQKDDPWTVLTQYENNPQDSGLTEFRSYTVHDCHLEYIEGFGYVIIIPPEENYEKQAEEIPLNECDVTAGCDPAGTKDGLKSKICKSAVVVWARDCKNRLFLLRSKQGYWSPFELFDEIFKAVDQFRGYIRSFGVESNAMQKILIPLLNEDKLKRNQVVHFAPIPNTGKKDPRIRITVGRPLQAGKVYSIPEVSVEFVSQKDKFPMAEFQKDVLDASEMAISLQFTPDSPEDREEEERALQDFELSRNAVTGYS